MLAATPVSRPSRIGVWDCQVGIAFWIMWSLAADSCLLRRCKSISDIVARRKERSQQDTSREEDMIRYAASSELYATFCRKLSDKETADRGLPATMACFFKRIHLGRLAKQSDNSLCKRCWTTGQIFTEAQTPLLELLSSASGLCLSHTLSLSELLLKVVPET